MNELENHIRSMAQITIEKWQNIVGGRLDYSQSSLESVEEILAQISQFVCDMNKRQINQLVEMFGCYIFEVAHREFGGRFLWYEQRNQPIIVVGEPKSQIAMLAFDKVQGRLSGDKSDNIPFFYAGFAKTATNAQAGINILYV